MKQPHQTLTAAMFAVVMHLMCITQAWAGHKPRNSSIATPAQSQKVASILAAEQPACVRDKSGKCVLPHARQKFLAKRPERKLGNGKVLERHDHEGVDISGVGEEVPALLAGKVIKIERDEKSAEGWFVKLSHEVSGLTLVSKYMHLAKHGFAPGLRVGSEVARGQLLGYVGSTGIQRDQAHLHMELAVLVNGKEVMVDPEEVIMVSTPVGEPSAPVQKSDALATTTPKAERTPKRGSRTTHMMRYSINLPGEKTKIALLLSEAIVKGLKREHKTHAPDTMVFTVDETTGVTSASVSTPSDEHTISFTPEEVYPDLAGKPSHTPGNEILPLP